MWPFKRKYPDLESLPQLSDDAHCWGVAEADLGDAMLVIRYNQGAQEWIAHPELSIKLCFAIPLNTPNEGGLPDPAENLQINEIEDTIDAEVEKRTKAIHALALTTGLMKEYVYYIPTGVDVASLHQAIQAVVTSHEVQCIAEKEPRWGSYLQFAPE